MATNPARKITSSEPQAFAARSAQMTESPNDGFGPRAVNALHSGNGHDQRELRTYTEEQVSAMLQVSRSQLRKWRMGWSRGQREGPPFKRLGRMIRYPESGLRAYIYGP